MGRKKTSQWRETHRQEVGVTVGESPRVGGTFALLYRITECRMVGREMRWRERVVPGATLYQAKQVTLTTAALLEMVATGVKALSEIARREDERATPKRKAR